MKVSLCLLLALFPFFIKAQYNDPNFSKPISGYGSDGPYSVGKVAFENPQFPGKNIEVYYPQGVLGKVPTIFYSHGYGGNISSTISGLLEFVAKKGYAIVFVPYQTLGVTIDHRYQNLLNGFRLAARKYTNKIDTTRVGFLGHSFGGGASFANAYKLFNENNWGANGRFIYALAQYYSFNITQEELKSFPTDTKVLIEVFEDDEINDLRMAMDIFKNINISNSEKDFILVKSDTIGGYVYAAGHGLPSTYNAFNALDYYAYYRLLDALSDYTFNGSAQGKAVALGNGSTAQISMPGELKDLVQTDSPKILFPESKYENACSEPLNPRAGYCAQLTNLIGKKEHSISMHPNPVKNYLQIDFDENSRNSEIKIYNSMSQLILELTPRDSSNVEIDFSGFPEGLYFVKGEDFMLPVIKD